MCTVTLIPLIGREAGFDDAGLELRAPGVRLACNRDEARTRPVASPPVVRTIGRRRVIMPVDPQSDGTWIAVNDGGIAAAVLNVNAGIAGEAGAGVGVGRLSRGVIIPRLMAAGSLDEAIEAGVMIDAIRHAPFRLVLLDGHDLVDFFSDGRTLRHRRSAIGGRPWLFTSSGLGDALVEPPRRDLFARMFAPGADWREQQRTFHRHAWPDRRHLSVCMDRADARTVSHTFVEIRPDGVRMTYTPDAPDRGQPLAPLMLPLWEAVR